MLVFSISDKGGTGRSVTSCNLAYRLSVRGRNVAYLDFDFGSPTSGAVFEIDKMDRGISEPDTHNSKSRTGLHRYLTGESTLAARCNVRSETNRKELHAPRFPYQLTLFPGDRGGGEFLATDAVVQRCVDLLATCRQEFDVTFVDLSAGRSAALEIALRATTAAPLRGATARWLIFHRWTRQHILAANGLVHGSNGLLDAGSKCGHSSSALLESVRYVRTAMPSFHERTADEGQGPQWAWLRKQNEALEQLARANLLGSSVRLGTTPVEPVLQWREQVILDTDVDRKIANEETVSAFNDLANRLTDNATWESLY